MTIVPALVNALQKHGDHEQTKKKTSYKQGWTCINMP